MQQTPWQQQYPHALRTAEDLVNFVNAVGCCTKKALPAYPEFPSQSAAMGDQYEALDDWFWKDDLHEEQRLYYTRVFGGQPGFISYRLLPAFIATNGDAADELIFTGAIPVEEQEIYHAIESHGPIGIKVLKKMLNPEAKRLADRLLIDLERRFIITKTGITGRERGTYGYIWDLTERWIPDMLTAADRLGRAGGEALLREHLACLGLPTYSTFYRKILGWGK